jgi:hypothetical protein
MHLKAVMVVTRTSMTAQGRLLPMAEFPIERSGARRYESAAVVPHEARPTPPPQKIDLPE